MSSSEPLPISIPLSEKLGVTQEGDTVSADGIDELELQIHAEQGAAGTVQKKAQALGATATRSYDDMVFGKLPVEEIPTLAYESGVRKVEERPEPMAFSTSEGVVKTNADQLHSNGDTGTNITVAVIDLFFNPDQTEIKDQVIATLGDSSAFMSGTSGLHGTACAEIVAEMAPDADIILAEAYYTGFVSVMDDITSSFDPEVMSMSLGYKPTNRLDGNDYLSNRILDFTQATGSNTSNGGLFAVAAGNEARDAHWGGPVQTNSNDYVEFDGTGETYLEIKTGDSGQEVVVQSDVDWHNNNQNFILETYDSNKNLLNTFSKTTTPAQAIGVPGSSSTTTTSYLRIKNDGLSGSNRLDVFTWGTSIILSDIVVADHSLGIPATSPDSETLSTGAVQHDTDELENFSSRGPTQDGRRGIDVAAPDGTKSDTYSGEFFGTSAACPHVGGGAALLFGATSATNDEIRQAFFDSGVAISGDENDGSISSPGSNNTEIGFGHIDVKGAYDALQSSVSISATHGDTTSEGGTAQIAISASEVDSITIEDLWLDWTVDSANRDGADSVSNDISSNGTFTFTWNSTASSVSPSLTVDLPSRYLQGGDFGIYVEGTGPGGTASDTAIVSIT